MSPSLKLLWAKGSLLVQKDAPEERQPSPSDSRVGDRDQAMCPIQGSSEGLPLLQGSPGLSYGCTKFQLVPLPSLTSFTPRSGEVTAWGQGHTPIDLPP